LGLKLSQWNLEQSS